MEPATSQSPEYPLLRLVERVTPDYAGKVEFSLVPRAKTVIESAGGKVRITAANKAEAARAYGYYLRNTARVHFSWNGDNLSAARFVAPALPIKVPAALPYNIAFNYCTYCYTGAHWSKAQWGREIDRLALAGYKYVLVTPGLEKVWQIFLTQLGYPAGKIAKFIPAPTYSAWWNMGNLEGEGGPVSPEMIESEAELGKFIAARARLLGLKPVLQGFMGFLPHDFPEGLIDGGIMQQGRWMGLYTRPAVLRADSADFNKAAALWYEALRSVYGFQAKAFCGDLFHEGGNKEEVDLPATARTVQAAMQTASPGAVWFLQAWANNPDPRFLQGTDTSKTVVLYLNKNMSERQGAPEYYEGCPHVWCEVANFGGNHGMFGGVPLLEKLTGRPDDALGLGLLSEGLETSPLYHALFAERLNHREAISRDRFLKNYCHARYGKVDEDIMAYLHLLAETVYNPTTDRRGCLQNIMGAKPNLAANRVYAASTPEGYYDTGKLLQAARHLLAAGRTHGESLTALPTYRFDLADVCRQVQADRAREQLAACRAAFDAGDKEGFAKQSGLFLQLIDDTAELLATVPDFLLGVYVQGARARGPKPADKNKMQQNLLRLITTWARSAQTSLCDYANREYAEVLRDYDKPRWQAYFDICSEALLTPQKDGKVDAQTYVPANPARIIAATEAFASTPRQLLREPHGDLMALAGKLLD